MCKCLSKEKSISLEPGPVLAIAKLGDRLLDLVERFTEFPVKAEDILNEARFLLLELQSYKAT